MSLALPTPNEYQQVLQHPESFLGDPRLKLCKVETDPLGMPKVRSGGFALTYHLQNNGSKWALRCFHKVVTERESRYAAICRFLSSHRSDILIPVEYIQKGILVKDNWYPITIMEWVEGDTLDTYLYKNINNNTLISNLAIEFRRLVDEKSRLQIAHGDLSHLNIIIRNGKMVLIDYDGMYVPELSGRKSIELGNPHFQHPHRNENHFDHRLDRFSEIVLYLTLTSLISRPDLYYSFAKGGEGLLFKRDDFIAPYNSRLLNELENIPNLKSNIRQFRLICQNDINNTPPLADFIQNQPITITSGLAKDTSPIGNNRFIVFNSTHRGKLLENEGEYATVIGQVIEVHKSLTYTQLPYVFLNFGNWREQCFTVVLWSETLDLFQQSGQDPASYEGQWVSVTGLISIYNSSYGTRPQIILDSPTNIEVITYQEAQQRLLGIEANSTAVIEVDSDQSQLLAKSITTEIEYVREQLPKLQPKPPESKPISGSNPVTSSPKETTLTFKSDISDKLNQLYSVPKDKPDKEKTLEKQRQDQKTPKGFLQRGSKALNKFKY